MAYCTNCGSEVPEGVKFCSNCGATVETKKDESVNRIPATDFSTENTSYERHTMGDLYNESPKKTWFDKLSKFFGLILIIFAFVNFQVDPPAFTIILSLVIIAGAIFCLSQKYKLKGLTIIALILAVICLTSSISQGKKSGFFKVASEVDYANTADEIIAEDITSVNEEEVKTEAVIKEESVQEEINTEAIVKEEEVQEETTEEVDAEIETVEEENEIKTENGVDPDLKAFLDSYEKFIDEYVVFMKKYTDDTSNAVAMLSEYTKIMEKYEDFAEKVDEYDSDEMSKEDEKYYLEVVNRCSQKMLEIY